MNITYRPLIWTRPRTAAEARRSRWTFKASWQSTLDLLDRELYQLDAGEVVLEADFREQDLRVDGMPRVNARQPDFPGIRLSFNVPGLGRVQYETDRCEFWQHNLRSIALGLEALRAVDRYGITSGRQQYTGFKAIGGGTPMSGRASMLPEDAAMFVSRYSADLGACITRFADAILTSPDVAGGAVRRAAKRLHPDAGGSTADFQRLQEAKEVLGL